MSDVVLSVGQVWRPTPNWQGVNRPKTVGIVIHESSGPTTQRAGESLEDWLHREYTATWRYCQNPATDVGPHFVVGSREITRMLHDEAYGWCQTIDNDTHIGIEFAQPASDPGYVAWQLEHGAELCANLCVKFGLPGVRVFNSYDRGIVGHRDTADGYPRKTDPGPQFPWDSFIARVRVLMGLGQYDASTLAKNGVPIGQAFADYLNEKTRTDPDYGEPRIMCEVNPTDDALLFLTTVRVLWWNSYERKVREVR